MTVDTLVAWVSANAIALVVGLIVLVVIYRFALPLMHRFVLAVLRAQQVTLEKGGAPADEVRKRAATLEDVLARLIKFGVFALLIMLILSVFDLWPMLAGLGPDRGGADDRRAGDHPRLPDGHPDPRRGSVLQG